MNNRKFKYLIIGVIAIVIFFSLKIINDYRERNLVDLVSYKPTDFAYLSIVGKSTVTEDKVFRGSTADKEATHELLEFLGQYRVKKTNEEEFNQNIKNGDKFGFTISHSKENQTIVMMLENDLHIYVGNYYKVVNGPIDMEWLRNYTEKYSDLYDE